MPTRSIIDEYVQSALQNAEITHEGHDSFVDRVPGFKGVFGHGKYASTAANDLADVLEDWIAFRLQHRKNVPVLDDTDYTAVLSTAGSWKDLVDADALKEQLTAERGSDRSPVNLSGANLA